MGGLCQDGTVGEPNGNPVSPRLFSSGYIFCKQEVRTETAFRKLAVCESE